ncbi:MULTISPECIES: isoprenylcysteine carboxylmethyltransferase family protein [unclassified Mesorhizobium]|uniref:methyltransferase family protein n=1 Tax=unclassified Mesorhizobium TaxID=325217 RepID=UPI0013DE9250|nr:MULTISPECIES: isoprenylcysteine carboxylmethyltransferase family protein [unclassified Mesorhizobium]
MDQSVHAQGGEKNPAAPVPACPGSASGQWTGMAGVLMALANVWLLRDWTEAAHLKTLAVLVLSAAVMLAVDLLVHRVQLNPTTELARDAIRPVDPLRLVHKLVGFWMTIGCIAGLYALLPEYGDAFYQPFKDAALYLLPGLIVASPFYILHVDRRQRDPFDAYAQLPLLLAGNRPANWSMLAAHARGWLVKAFFLPLMFVYANNDLGALWSAPLFPQWDFRDVFARLIDVFYLLDVLLAVIAYTLTLRVIDSHIRSTEPTIGGWAICLICYRPFVDAQGHYIQYELDELHWDKVLAPYPWLYVLWGSAILLLVFIYVWSTAAFGLRFSNLTHRGIITNGPYRWVKHPAYLSKNLCWWLISVPFVAGAGWLTAVQSCLMLGAANLVYYLRARTEERHLSADPIYRDYQAFIAEHGLVARVLKLVQPPASRSF